MKTAIYARRSTIKRSQNDTIQNQIKICKRRAKEMGLTIVDVKTDSSTGTTDAKRDEVKELIRGALNGDYECVIMKGISRFYRDVEHGLGLIKKLDRSNIRVITIEENFDSLHNRTGTGQLDTSMITMYLMFAENESKKTSERIKYTQIEKAHNGEWNQAGSVPFGYAYDPDTKKLKIDPIKSETLKMIFNLYVEGMGMKSIAQYLNGDNPNNIKYPSSKGKLWNQYTVGYMLKNPVYIGYVEFNKRSKTARPYKNPAAIGKTEDDVYYGTDYNDKKDWIRTKAHEAIISDEVFENVQRIISNKGIRKGIKSNISLLAGIAKCGKCDAGMTFKRGNKDSKGRINTKSNYYCSRYIKYGNRFCDSHHVGADELENMIISKLKEKLIKINSETVTSNLKSKPNEGELLSEKIKKLQIELQILSKKTSTLLDKNINGIINDAQFAELNKTFSMESEVIAHQLEKLIIKQAENKENNSSKNYLNKIYEEVVNIEKYPKEKQRYILLDLIKEITVIDGNITIQYKF